MTPRPAIATLILMLGAAPACSRDGSHTPQSQASAVAVAPHRPRAAAIPQDTTFAGTMAPVQRTRSLRVGVGTRPPMLRAVETPLTRGYDRVVFEFTGDSVPGYHVEYATGPVQRCGSGDPVTVAGAARLVVRFEPAEAHDIAVRQAAPALPAVRELTLVCDFEGQVEWVLGVAARAPYRVSELSGPPRLVLDVKRER